MIMTNQISVRKEGWVTGGVMPADLVKVSRSKGEGEKSNF